MMNVMSNCVVVNKTAERVRLVQTEQESPQRWTATARRIIVEARMRVDLEILHLESGHPASTCAHERGVVLVDASDMYIHTSSGAPVAHEMHAEMDPVLLTTSKLLETEFLLSPSPESVRQSVWLTSSRPNGQPVASTWPLALVGRGGWKTKADCKWWPVARAQQFYGSVGIIQVHQPECVRVYT